MPLLDELLPTFDVRERHSVVLPVAPERALQLALDAPAVPDRLVRLLFRARGLPAGPGSIGDFASSPPFEQLAHTDTEFVAGLAGRSALRILIDFRVEPRPGGSLLSTETRVLALTTRARRRFRAYWLLVAPFSALVRRRWLRAVEARVHE